MTRYQLHCLEWKNCERCHYSETRKKVVLGKGSLPCDVLFVGEAPGESEDVHGEPFIGQSGRILDRIVRDAVPIGVSTAFNNLTGCYPMDDGEKGEPSDECIEACTPRLIDFVRMANPKIVVTVGKLPERWLDQTLKGSIRIGPVPQLAIVHPAAILRAPFVQRSLMVMKCVVNLRKAIKDHVTGEKI